MLKWIKCLAVCHAALAMSACMWGDVIYQGKVFRVTGALKGGVIEATQVQLRPHEENAQRGQLDAMITEVDVRARRIVAGETTFEWTDNTRFVDLKDSDLKPGVVLRVDFVRDNQRMRATRVQTSNAVPPSMVRLTGAVARETRIEGNHFEVEVLGRSVRIEQPGYNRNESLTRRQDTRRPDQPISIDVLSRPLIITGEYDLSFRDRKNLRLDQRSHVRDLDQELKLELLYPLTQSALLFLSGKAVYEDELKRVGGETSTTKYLARDQTWIYLDQIAGTGFSLQAGRQNFSEAREWWWDDDLDALRLYYDRGPWHGELGLAREIAREKSSERTIDPALRDVKRLVARWSWLWASKQSLDLFYLHHDDRSDTETLGQTLASARQDESDARLRWLGLRAIGDRSISGLGDARYWMDASALWGSEKLIEYDDDRDPVVVEGRTDHRVRGYAYDAGLSLRTRLPGRPALTVGYAWGSGDSNSADSIDRSFRQTGLHNNKWRFHGVNRFRYYGELFRPELSNLSISTLALGFGFWRESSVEFVHHRYLQAQASRELRDARISASPNGRQRHLGDEIDIVFGLREWKQLELLFTASRFRAGNAFGALNGRKAYQFTFEAAYNF